MGSLAFKQQKNENVVLKGVITEMKNNSRFYGELITSNNVTDTLRKNGFKLDIDSTELLSTTIQSIQKTIKMELGKISEMVNGIAISADSGNGTGGW